MSACSDSQSTILPLPSSPHWEPITTTFAMRETSSNGRSRLGWFGFRLQPLVPILDDAGRSKKNWLSPGAVNSANQLFRLWNLGWSLTMNFGTYQALGDTHNVGAIDSGLRRGQAPPSVRAKALGHASLMA